MGERASGRRQTGAVPDGERNNAMSGPTGDQRDDDPVARRGRRRRAVGFGALGLGLLGAAATLGSARAADPSFEGIVDLVDAGVPTVPDVDITQPAATCANVRDSIESYAGPAGQPLTLKIPGFTLGVRVSEATITVNCGTSNLLELSGNLELPREGQLPLPVATTIRLDWADGVDAVPDVRFEVDAGNAITGNIVELSSATDLASALIPGVDVAADDLPADLRLRRLQVDARWTESDGWWFDGVVGTQIRHDEDDVSDTVNVNLLLSVTADPGGEPVVLTGLHADPIVGDTFTMGGIFRGAIGEYLAAIELPEMHMAYVQPDGATVNLQQHPIDRTLPRGFFTEIGGILPPEDQEFDSELRVSATVELDSLPTTVRETFGYAEHAVARIRGTADITFGDLFDDGLDAITPTAAELTMELPGVTGSQATALPDWVDIGATTMTIAWDGDADAFVFSFETAGQLHIPDESQPAGEIVLAPTLAGEIQVLGEQGGDVVTIGIEGTVPGTPDAPAWPNPYALDWLDLYSVGANLVVIQPLDDTVGDQLEIDASVTASFAIGGKTFGTVLRFEREAGETQLSINITLEEQIALSEILDHFGVDLPDEFDVMVGPASPTGDPVSLTATFTVPAGGGEPVGTVAINAPGTIHIGSSDFGVSFLIELESKPGGGFQVLAGARLDSTTMSELVGAVSSELATAVAGTPFGPLALPDTALLFTIDDVNRSRFELTEEAKAFFDPLYGCADDTCQYDVKLAAGVHLLSALTMPEDPDNAGKPVFDDVFRAFWLDGAPPVLLDLSVPVPTGGGISFSGVSFDLRLPIRPAPDVRPDWFRSADLGIGLRLSQTGVRFEVSGDLGIRMLDDTHPSESACATASKHWQPMTGGSNGCYDLLDFAVAAAVNLGPVPSFTLEGAVQSEGGWRSPFGLEFLEFGGVAIQFTVEVPPSGNASFLIGLYASGKLILDDQGFEKDMVGSVVIGLRVIQGPPFVIPEFRGIRIASQAGLELADLQRLYDIARDTATDAVAGVEAELAAHPELETPPWLGQLGELAQLPELHLDDTGLPNIGLRNVELMVGLGDFPRVCISTGVRLGAELYIGAAPVDGSTIEVETPDDCPTTPIADPIGCLAKPVDPCDAAASLDVGLGGIKLAGSMNEFVVGPITWDAATFQFDLTPTSQRMSLRGGAEIAGLADGEVDLTIAPDGIAFLGDVTLFPGSAVPPDTPAFRALVEGEAALSVIDLFEDPTQLPGDLDMHVVLQSDFDALVRDITEPPLIAFRDTVATTVAVYEGLKATDGDPVQTLIALPDDLRALDVTVPAWFDDPDGIDLVEAVETIDGLMRDAGLDTPTMGQLFSGIEFDEPFTLPGVVTPGLAPIDERCWVIPFPYLVEGVVVDDVCYSVYITGIPGIGDLVPGAPSSFTEFLTTVVEPRLTQALVLVGLPADTDFVDLTDELLAQLRSVSLPIDLSCADFRWTTDDTDPGVTLRLGANVFGVELGFDLGWSFDQPAAAQALALADQFIAQVLDPAAVTCEPIGTTTIGGQLGAGGGAGLVADTSFRPTVSPTSVPEGGTTVLGGFYGNGLDDSEPATVDWGDGPPVATSVGALRQGLAHAYADDDPSGTPADSRTVAVTIDGRTEDVLVGVVNVPPTALALDHVADIDEGETLTLGGTFSDPGANDTFTVDIRWGDGSPNSTAAVVAGSAPGTWSFEATHRFADDNPTRTAIDTTRIRVAVNDDDGGATATASLLTVADVAPSNVVVTPVLGADQQIEEGVAVTYRITWDDPGTDEFFVIVDDFGDGTGAGVRSSAHSVDITHVYRDDEPDDADADVGVDPVTISVTVVDDDTLSATASRTVDVHNVDPVVDIVAPQGWDGDGPVQVQYSDPLGWTVDDDGNFVIQPFSVTARDVTSDTGDDAFALTLTYRRRGSATALPQPAWLDVGEPTCTADPDSDHHSICTWELSADVADSTEPYIHTDLPPGEYELVVTVVDDDTGSAANSLAFDVVPEDARIWYVGTTFAATESALDGEATIELRSTVRDITSAVPPSNGQWDPWPGDVRTATVTFEERTDGLMCAAPGIDEVVNPFDVFDQAASVGIGACLWTTEVTEAEEYVAATVIGGRYVRDSTNDDAVVTVARPLGEFITGGGYLVLTDSSGVFAGGDATHANFGFHVKFNRRATNLQGGVTIIVRTDDGRVLQIKSNSMDSLGVDNVGHAQFESKAALTDVTDEGAATILGGNYTLQMTMTDRSTADGEDEISFTLWDVRKAKGNLPATRLLLFSSNWTGNATVNQQIAGGNLMVHAR
jgi:hypothetical protein